ncbi:MAG: N-acyl homoserine lactonase family protein [Archaeoglobaceae archaeon]|nr:N-acyl homoserine lactonase family protein [Archaeoglobaceae archaeon]MDW7989496.1 N-acyl homoserine lactonase family protein [Archaeoglobaceae archaeon]
MRIKPLLQARIRAPLSVVFMFGSPDYMVSGSVYIWVIEGERVVVDAGVAENSYYPIEGGGEKGVIKALEREEIKPKEVEKLVITHLHFDHIANVHLFHNAKIYVQKADWEFANNPIPIFRDLYVDDYLFKLEEMDLCFVEGDIEILPGVKLIHLPGHTPGLQGVVVETRGGDYLLSGDHFYSYLNIFPPRNNLKIENEHGKTVISAQKSPFLPPGIHVNLSDWFESCYKTMRFVKKSKIIPGHDPSLEGKVFE